MYKKLCILIIMSMPFINPYSSWSADWHKLLDNNEETCYADIDLASRQKHNEKEARELTVFKNPKEISRKLEYAEYDCSSKKRRIIQALIYKKNGEVTLTTKPNANWGPIETEEKSIIFYKTACGEK